MSIKVGHNKDIDKSHFTKMLVSAGAGFAVGSVLEWSNQSYLQSASKKEADKFINSKKNGGIKLQYEYIRKNLKSSAEKSANCAKGIRNGLILKSGLAFSLLFTAVYLLGLTAASVVKKYESTKKNREDFS